MKPRILVAALTVVAVTVPTAHAHLLDGLKRDVSRRSARHTARVIHDVFNRRNKAHEAQKVVSCESSFRVTIKSSNGEYWGLFQMGSGARSNYDWGWTRRQQTRAAHAYFRDAGWSPWAYCAP